MAFSRTQVRQEMLRRVPVLGRALVADSIGITYIVQVSEYERQRAGLTSYEGQYAHRYNLADPDRWRRFTTLDSGAANGHLNVDGPAYVNQSDTAYERLGIHPDEINGFIIEAQRRQKVRTNIALVANNTHDLDMELSGIQYWGSLGGSSGANVTPLKITSDVRSGTQALQVTTSNASNVLWGEQIRVTPGANCGVGIIFRAPTLSGSFTWGLRDAQASSIIASNTISGIGGGEWVMGWIQTALPATTNLVNIFFETNHSADVYIIDTCFGPYLQGQTDFTLQSAINEAYKLRFVRPSSFRIPLSMAGFWSAQSLVFDGDLTSPENFVVEAFARDANPARLRLIPSAYYPDPLLTPTQQYFGAASARSMRPVWLAMEAQVSDFEPLLNETDTTNQPLDLIVGYALRLLAEDLVIRKPGEARWQQLLKEYEMYAAVEDEARPPQPAMPQRRYHAIRA